MIEEIPAQSIRGGRPYPVGLIPVNVFFSDQDSNPARLSEIIDLTRVPCIGELVNTTVGSCKVIGVVHSPPRSFVAYLAHVVVDPPRAK